MLEKRARVGILTFHWATNYGAVLQAYALQRVLERAGFRAELIDFVPYRVYLSQTLSRMREHRFLDFFQEYRIRRFLERTPTSRRRYWSSRSLGGIGNLYDAVIAGSDQIWNENITLVGEHGPLLAYFLNWVDVGVKRVAYAASVGTGTVSKEYRELTCPEIRRLDMIGVREESGKRIVEECGARATVVLDPTLLLGAQEYISIVGRGRRPGPRRVVSFMLHGQEDERVYLAQGAARAHYSGDVLILDRLRWSVGDWLRALQSAAFVVTNSYHAVVFCIQFGVPFVVIPSTAGLAGMNDRMETLLSLLELQDRILVGGDDRQIEELVRMPIDWSAVQSRLSEARSRSVIFLASALEDMDA